MRESWIKELVGCVCWRLSAGYEMVAVDREGEREWVKELDGCVLVAEWWV